MGIKKNENGTYTVSYCKRHPVTNKPVSLRRINVETHAKAKRVQAELILKVEDRLKKTIVPTWKNLLQKYFEEIQVRNSLTTDTVYNREKILYRHTFDLWGERYIDEITTKDIHNLLSEKLISKSESHKKFINKCIKSVFQFAVEEDLLVKNPAPLLKFKNNQKNKPVLNEEQIVILLRKAQELDWPWYPHYAVGLYTGLRSGELYALTWDKIDLDKRQILVNCSWSSKSGFKSTKSGDDRIVEIPKPLIPVLRDLKIQAIDDYVLPRLHKWETGEQARDLRMFLKSIGLHEIRFHDLRASWATMLLSRSVAPSKVMSMGGWKDMKTMMIYMRKAGIDIKGATSCLDDMQIHGIQAAKVVNFDPCSRV